MDKMIRGVAYLRVSTEEQVDGYSLDAQLDHIKRYCEYRGITLLDTYCDPGRSGKSAARPDFQRMIADAHQGAFDVVLVHKLDRFSRSLVDVLTYLGELEKSGVTFASVSEQFDFSTPSGRAMMQLLAVFSEWYLNNLREEVKKGKRERARQGGWNGTLSYGYTTPKKLNAALTRLGEEFKANQITEADYAEQCGVIEDHLEKYDHASETDAIPDPHTWMAVVRAFAAYSTDMFSDAQIASLLNSLGYRISSHGRVNNPFGKETIADMLRNRFYLGETSYGGGVAGSAARRKIAQYIPGTHEALISRDLFDRCQEIRARRGKNQSRSSAAKKNDFPLTGLLTCLDCGGAWSGWTNGGYRYYRRRTPKHGCSTETTSRSATVIEQEIAVFLTGVRLPDDWRARVLELLSDSNDQVDYAEERTKLERVFDRLKNLYQWGDIDEDTYNRETSAIRIRIAELNAAHNVPEMRDFDEAAKLMTDIRKLWNKATADDRRILARHMFKRIYLVEGVIKAIEPTPVMWVLLRVVRYSVRGEQGSNLSGVTIVAPETSRETVFAAVGS